MFNTLINIMKNIEMRRNHGFYHNGRFHSVKMIKGKPYREVVEVLVLKGDEIFVSFRPNNPTPQFPGGSIEPGKSIFDIAYSECQEEARITIRKSGMNNNKDNDYIKQLNNPDRSKWKKEYNGYVDYVGKYVHIVTAEYKEKFTGFIDSRDVHIMSENGKFYKIIDVMDYLNRQQLNALALTCVKTVDNKQNENVVKHYKKAGRRTTGANVK